MPLVVGIDEAGYGPLLGPLVIGASIWHVSADLDERAYWRKLRSVVCRKPGRKEWRLPVNDSKQIYSTQRGIALLERSVLAFACAAKMPAATIDVFLGGLGAHFNGDAQLPPWYRELAHPLPLGREQAAYAAIAQRLAGCMERNGLRCCALLAEVVTENQFNARMRQTRNKAAVLIERITRIIQRATDGQDDQTIHVHVDRLGGRHDYGQMLMTAFPDRHLHVVSTGDELSCYRLANARSDWHIDFRIDADQYHLPVALASMVAKYARELVMHRFNEFWRGLAAELRPTAGYYKDAHRFIREIEPLLARARLHSDDFIRLR